MFKFNLLLAAIFAFTLANAQSYQEYGEVHLLGPISIGQIEAQPPYNQWFSENAKKFELPNSSYDDLHQKLNDLEVNIYFGTWCSDSQYWVPQLIRLWDKLSLDRSKLHLIALDGRSEHYKQGPNGEEKGKKIIVYPYFNSQKMDLKLVVSLKLQKTIYLLMWLRLPTATLQYPIIVLPTTSCHKLRNVGLTTSKQTSMPII